MSTESVCLGLVLWLAVATLVVRRAERGVSATDLPVPWPTTACATVLIAIAFAVRPLEETLVCGTACVALIAMSGPDYRTGFLFDAITLPTALLVTVLAGATGAVGNAAGGVAILVGAFGTLVVLSRGRLMGLGDVKAMFSIGAAFGPLESIVAIFAACVSGIVAALVTARFKRDTELRFGPHLAIGSAFALVAGNPIVHNVMGL